MSDTDPDLDRLQDLLNAIPVARDGMTVAELDGYVAALIVCPEVILPSEWLPGVWGGEHEFVDVAKAEATIAAVMEHYNRIARELAEHPEDYAPVFEIDPNSGESGGVLCEDRRHDAVGEHPAAPDTDPAHEALRHALADRQRAGCADLPRPDQIRSLRPGMEGHHRRNRHTGQRQHQSLCRHRHRCLNSMNEAAAINAIRDSHPAGELIRMSPETENLLAQFIQSRSLQGDEADDQHPDDDFVPDPTDRREMIVRSIRQRRGQSGFRSGLIRRYGANCMISGCKLLQLVEAAHIWPYCGEEDNHPGNGLLLRADLHTLFDLDLLGIEPGSLTVRVGTDIADHEYAKFDGTRLIVSNDDRPSDGALRSRWDSYREREG